MYEVRDYFWFCIDVTENIITSSFHSYLCAASQGAAVHSDAVGFLQHAVDVIQK